MPNPAPNSACTLIHELSRHIEEVLRDLLAGQTRCALLDCPTHANVGDNAIWLGERAYLRRAGIQVDYLCSHRTYSESRLRARIGSGPILLSGGGNLGDLWPEHQRLREAVIRAFPANKIIQFPQSIHFEDPGNLARARAIFDAHPDLTLLLRDRRSLELARSEFRSPGLLCPDMGFALGPLPRTQPANTDLLCLLRQDAESAGHAAAPAWGDAIRTDWPGDQPSPNLSLSLLLAGQRQRHPRLAERCAPLLAPLYRRAWEGLARERVQRACSVLSRGRVVVTDRLHGHILSLLLGIPHVILDNRVGKVRGFHDTWTHRSGLVRLAQTLEEAAALAREWIGQN